MDISKGQVLEEKYLKIEEQKEALRISRERYKLAVEGAGVGIWDYDYTSKHLYMSSKAQQIVGVDSSKNALSISHVLSYVYDEDKEAMMKAVRSHLSGETELFEVQCRLHLFDDKYIWLACRGRALFDGEGKPLRIAGSVSNIDKEKVAEQRIIELAYYDMLTRLPNKYFFEDRIGHMICDPEITNFALIFIDLDNLKAVNDSVGYTQGDKVIKKVADTLGAFVNDTCDLFRFGGDEFIMITKNKESREDLEVYLASMLERFQEPFDIEGLGFSITLSIGVSMYPFDGESIDVLLRHADTALNHVKTNGKNGFEIFSFELNRDLKMRLALESDLRKAVEYDELVLYYQPKYAMDSHEIVGYEALLRWCHPTRGIVSPLSFIPVAEETGLIIPIGEWVIREAVSQLEKWHLEGHDQLSVSINLSAKQLKDVHLLSYFKKIIKDCHVPARFLELEITETAALYDMNYAINILNELKKLGLKVSLDDFGTGYSSLNYLTALPVDTLKIDKSFLTKDNNKQNIEIIKAVIALAHACEMNVVAEGVETIEQLEFLEAHQCDLLQGFYFSKPLPHLEAIELKIKK